MDARGVNVNARDETGEAPLHVVCDLQWYDCAKRLLEHGADVNIVHNEIETYIVPRPVKENTKLIDLLTSYGRKVNTQLKDGSTALHLACTHRQIEDVKKLLELGADANIVDDCKNNALHYAVRMEDDNTEIINLLVKKGLDVNAQNEGGKTSLHFACEFRGYINANELLQNGADANVVDNNNESTLHFAAQTVMVCTEIINLLRNHEVEVNAQDNKGRTLFLVACESGRFHNASKLLEYGADANIADYKNNNALHYAASTIFSKPQMITLLIRDYGCHVNSQNDEGLTALQLACRSGRIETVKELLRQGADGTVLNHEERIMRFYGENHIDSEVIDLMLKNGLDINARDEKGMTPLLLACLANDFEGVTQLLERNVDINAVDASKMNALHYAAQSEKKNENIINLLISRGVDINAQDHKGRSPLHLATLGNVLDNFILIGRSANLNVVDNKQMTVLHYAAKNPPGNQKILNYLLTNVGFNVNVRNDQEETPLHLACKFSENENIQVLLNHNPDINAVTFLGRSILHYVVDYSLGSYILHTICVGVDKVNINACDVESTSVLHTACKNGDYEKGQLLISLGADVYCVDNKKRNALHYAAEAKNSDKLLKLLIDLGVDPKAEDLNGANVLDYAIKNENYGAVKMLIEANIFDTSDASFLYYSVFSGCCYGVNLFRSERGIDNIDTNNVDFPLHFATKNGEIDMSLLIGMTQFIDKMISFFKQKDYYCRYASDVKTFSHRGLIAYLEMLSSSNQQIDLIFKEADNWYLSMKRSKLFINYLEKYYNKANFNYFSNKQK